jgi:Tfp pilus assembly PilM family ATPase
MARTATGIDIGAFTAIALRGSYKGGTLHVTGFSVGSIDQAGEVSERWSALDPEFKPTRARVGLSGRDLNIRYTQVPRVPDWQLRKLMRFEVAEVGGQSGAQVASDFNLLPAIPEIEGEDVVLLAMAREAHLSQHLEGLSALGGKLDAFTPNALALYAAWLRFGAIEEETVLIADIGHEHMDVILVRGPDLLFARNLGGGSALFDQAIAERLGVSPAKAREIKHRMVSIAGAGQRDATAEKASRACMPAAGQLLSLLQSAVMFCKSQVKISGLKVDRVLLCGGGARLAGLPAYLSSGMNVPVEHFDPFTVVDTSALDPAQEEQLHEHKLEAVVALGLATMGSDPEAYSVEILPERVRRSRQFFGGTLFLWAAGLVAALFLAFHAWNQSQRLSALSARVRQLEAAARKAGNVHRQTQELLEQNAANSSLANELFALAGSGEQIARTLGALERSMPEEFWITRLTSSFSADTEFGIERERPAPIVHLEGRAREGTESMASLFEGFVGALQARIPGAKLKPRPSPSGDRFEIDLTLHGALDPEQAAEAGEEAEAPEENPKK